jgi:type I restriction enzyme, S subunit
VEAHAAELVIRILKERRAQWEFTRLAKFRGVGKVPKYDDWKEHYEEPTPPNTHELPALPKGWAWVTLDQLTNDKLIGLDRGRAEQYQSPDGVPYIKMNNITLDGRVDVRDLVYVSATAEEQSRFALAEGDLLFNTRNSKELVGKVGLIRQILPAAVYNNNLMRIRVVAGVSPQFVCFQMCSEGFRRRMELVKKSTTNVAAVYAKDLFPLPLALAPLPEQRRIVAEIEKQFTRLDAGVASLKRVQAALKRYRASVLKAACEGQLVSTEAELARQEGRSYEPGMDLLACILKERRKNWNGRGKYKEPAAPDLPALPEGWTWASVEQLLTEPLCNGISVKGSDKPPGIRALRLSAMSDSGFDYSDARYLPLPEPEVDDLWINESDFFMSRGNGSLHLVGRGTSAQKPPQPTIFPDTMIRLRLTSAVRISGWVRTLWPSRIVRSQIESKVKTTAGIYKIAQPQVEQIVIPLPPLAEQNRIVAEVERRLTAVGELESMVSSNLKRATYLRQSILRRAFLRPL